jgi:hypothetical protein
MNMNQRTPKPKLRARPCSFKEAKSIVSELHRHHKVPQGLKWAMACDRLDGDEWVTCGVIISGRPVARAVDQTWALEVTRLATDGTYNVCSFLYARAARAAEAMGYHFIQTYILDSEPGTSLKAAGWSEEQTTRKHGRGWNNRSGRRDDQPVCKKTRYRKYFPKNGGSNA